MAKRKQMQNLQKTIKNRKPSSSGASKVSNRLKTAATAHRGGARAQAAMNRLKKRGK